MCDIVTPGRDGRMLMYNLLLSCVLQFGMVQFRMLHFGMVELGMYNFGMVGVIQYDTVTVWYVCIILVWLVCHQYDTV